MKRVLIITYYWPPSGGAGVQRWLKFAKFLPEFGWDPIVLVPHPDKATYPVKDFSQYEDVRQKMHVIQTDSSELFNAYKKVTGSNNIPYAGFANDNGPVSFKQKLSRFVRGNFFLPDPRKGWNKHAIKAASKYLEEQEVDCMISTGPPHSSHLIAQDLKMRYSIPWLADFRDPWTDIYYYKDFYPTKLAHWINLRMEKTVLEQADKILTVSPSWEKMFKSKIKSDFEKVSFLTNGYDEDDFPNQTKRNREKFYFTYIGTMSDIYPIDAFLEALKMIIQNYPKTVFRLIGTISQSQRSKITKLPKDNYELIPYVDHHSVSTFLYEASALLLLVPEHDSSKGIVPGKLFEYMAVGRPILVIGPEEGDSASIVKKANTGDFAQSNEIEKIATTLESWIKAYPTISPDNAFSRKTLTGKLSLLLNEISR